MWIKLSIWLKGRRPPEFFSSKVAVPDSHVVSQRHINHEGPVKFRALTQGSTHQPKGPTAREFVRHLGNLSNSNEQVISFSQDPLSSDEACQRVSADPLSISSIVTLSLISYTPPPDLLVHHKPCILWDKHAPHQIGNTSIPTLTGCLASRVNPGEAD